MLTTHSEGFQGYRLRPLPDNVPPYHPLLLCYGTPNTTRITTNFT
jgi:hypothetical protein